MLQVKRIHGCKDRMALGEIVTHETEIMEFEAKFALAVMEKWGMVAAMPDGEDSSGRQQLRLATPEELVARAFAIAKLAFQRTRDDSLMVAIPEFFDKD